MKTVACFSVAIVSLMNFACTAGMATSEEIAKEDPSAVGEALCYNQAGMNAVTASIAVATAVELRRWNAPVDFQWNNSTNRLDISAAGKARCWDGKCRNVQALLDLQKPEAYHAFAFPGGELFDHGYLVGRLKDAFSRQQRCNAWQGEYTTNGCWVENHDIWLDHRAKGTCAMDNYFWVNKVGTTLPLDHIDRMNYQLYFAGYPENEFLNFRTTGTAQMVIDPTVGLTEGDTTSSGSCTASCTRYSTSSVIGQCCLCNGVTKTFSRSPFSYDMYLCR
jgi:hypothetical protein